MLNKNIWWLDFSILNFSNIKFKFYYANNIFFLEIKNYYLFCLLNKKNVNCMLLYNLDSVIVSEKGSNSIYSALQTFFFDIKILINTEFSKSIKSISCIYPSNLWVERELKEFNNVNFINMPDTRKLLSNYNYNNLLVYNNFNNILNDVNI